MDPLPPIPTPASQRWREFRIQILPFIIFVAVLAAVFTLWRNYVQPAPLVGEVEATKANVISLHDGVITEFLVDRFQHVTKGQPLCRVLPAEAERLQAQLGADVADLGVVRSRILIDERGRAQSYERFRLDILDQKVLLSQAKMNYIEASNNFVRIEQLVREKFDAPAQLDTARAKKDSLEAEINGRTTLINDLTKRLDEFAVPLIPPGQDPVQAAIAAKEKAIQSESEPTVLTAPMDGIVSLVYKRGGERVLRGEPILVVSNPDSTRIVGYLRQPISVRPATNETVRISSRAVRRQVGVGTIVQVGAQLELINPALISTDPNRVEHGLPILITMPEGLKLYPGEFVDIAMAAPKR